jgi:hypothetical protein
MEDSAFKVRLASEFDLPEIAEFFARYNFGPKCLEWARWKYLSNPDGEAIIYVAEDSDGRVVAISPRMPPRFVSAETGEFTVRQNVDLLVADKLKGTGVYAMISRQAGSEREYLLMGFPNKLSRRLINAANTHIAPIVNWVFPVVAGNLIAMKPYGIVAPLVNVLCRAYAFLWLGGKPNDLHMQPLERFTNDFKLDSTLIHGIRSADYLNWRYIDNPMQEFMVYGFFEGIESIGYCAYTMIDSTAEIYDFIAHRREKSCLRLLVEDFRKKRLTHLSFPGVGLHLGRLGFLNRGSNSDFTVAKAEHTPPLPSGKWMVTFCDRDV